MTRRIAKTLTAAAVGTLSWLSSGDAEACHFFEEDDGISRTTVCFTSLHAGVATLIFAPADIYFASKRQWLTPEWAWTQLILGGLVTMGGGFTALGIAATDDDTAHPAEDIGWSLATVAVGGFYSSVAVFSLDEYREPRDTKANSWLKLPNLALVPVDGGAMVTASF